MNSDTEDDPFPRGWDDREEDLPVVDPETRDPVPLSIGDVHPLLSELDEHELDECCRIAIGLEDHTYVAALPVRIDQQGEVMLVAIPLGVISEKRQPQSPKGLSPVKKGVRCHAQGPGKAAPKADVLFLCLGDEVFAAGRVCDWAAAAAQEEGRSAIAFGRSKTAWPLGAEIAAAAMQLGYVGGEDEAWFTASDAPLAPASVDQQQRPGALRRPKEGPDDDLRKRMDKLETHLAALAAAVTRPQAGTAPTPPNGPSGDEDDGRGVGRRGVTWTKPVGERAAPSLRDVRGSLAKPKLDEVPRRAARGPAEMLQAANMGLPGRSVKRRSTEDSEDEEERRPGWGPSAEDPVGMLMMSASRALDASHGLQSEKKKKKKKIYGLSAAPGGSDGSSDSDTNAGAGGARGLERARRLQQSMNAEPAAFNQEFRERMREHLKSDSDSHKLSLQYAMQLPVERSKMLGYFVWAIASINQDLKKGDPALAELRSMRVLASLEQFMIDQHWRSAWPLSGLDEPPWPLWEHTSLSSHQRTHTASPLLSESWVATAISRTRDEQFLRRQRGKGEGRGGKVDDQDGGGADAAKGGGRGNGRG